MQNTATTPAPFVWDNDYKNTEQVRPYLDAFMEIREGIQGTAYNSLFEGRIPGLTESANERTGIYLLQKLADLEKLRERTEACIHNGGYRLADRIPHASERGTLCHIGFFMGDTGWTEVHHAKVTVDEASGHVRFKLPRQRNWRTHHDGPGAYLFMPT